MEFPGVGGYSVPQYALRGTESVVRMCKEWLGYVLQATKVRIKLSTTFSTTIEDMVGMLLVVPCYVRTSFVEPLEMNEKLF